MSVLFRATSCLRALNSPNTLGYGFARRTLFSCGRTPNRLCDIAIGTSSGACCLFSTSACVWKNKKSKAKAKKEIALASSPTSTSNLKQSPNLTSTTTSTSSALDESATINSTTTMAPPLATSDHTLVTSLSELASQKAKSRNKKLVSSSVYPYPHDSSITIRSWKLNEYRYYDVPSPFPTLARGLFTTWVPNNEGQKSEEGDGNGRHRIVARGYDKFFNIGEVPWCKWTALEAHTDPPYVMTLKSNGCIIFIAALTPTQLLVTSKHSLGPVKGSDVSHAEMGERWLVRQLGKKGKTTEQLAAVLWEKNWTAVAELCDDSFEEHVLPYALEKTGLHLHGLNESTGAFRTMPSDQVAAFAREWGLIETPYHIVNSIADIRAFSDEVAKRGEWNGEAIEGFVVRCHVRESGAEESGRDRDAPPYPPGSSFFFKVKYDEPYMMYRDWREITKILLSSSKKYTSLNDVPIPKSKLRRPESHLYLKWVREEIKRDPAPFKDYSEGKGIIKTRERFLEWMKEHDLENLNTLLLQVSITDPYKTDLDTDVDEETSKPAKPTKKFGKTIILPVAIPGCGKTTVAVALAQLFGFGHIQSDDIPGKKAAQEFVKRVMKELEKKDVVIADKNNHLLQHRTALRDTVRGKEPPVRLLALYWPIAMQPPAMVHRICSDRILARGKNHQTLRPSDEDVAHHEGIVWMFIRNSQELTENEVDEIIEMPLEDDGGSGEGMQESLARAVDACVRILGLPRPSLEDIGKALASARGYKVPDEKIKENEEKQQKEKEKEKGRDKVRYYALLPEVDLKAIIEERFAEAGKDEIPAEVKELWEKMLEDERITQIPHVTLVHSNNIDDPSEEALWDACRALSSLPHSPSPLFTFRLKHLVCDGRLMALTVEDLKPYAPTNPDDSSLDDEEGLEAATNFVQKELSEVVKKRLHVTIGTRGESVKPYEARAVVESWRMGNSKEVRVLELGDVVVKGRVKGLMG